MVIGKIKVTGTRAYTIEALDIPQGIVGATVSFDFSEDWAGLTKNVVFIGAKDVEILDIQDSVNLPPEVVAAQNVIVKVGVVGVDANKKMVIPTLWADLGTVKPGAPVDMGYDPTLPIWAQLLGMIGDLRNLNTVDKSNLVAAVNEAVSNSGGGNGAGEGGYYTPVVTQPTSNTMQISFVPSVATMPAVEPVTITLPGSDSGQNANQMEPAEDDIPKVYFTGTLPTSKAEDDVQLTMHYISKTADFTYPVTLKVQGSSSASYAKKNFTLKPYKDSTYEKKQKLAFKGWPEMNKFVLKAHWIDHSHVRNVGTAKIWGKIVKSRSDYANLPEELRTAANNGATDGFTVKVFANGVYQGLYEWIVPKDKLFGQDSDISTHSILNSEWNNQATCAFATTSPVISGNWSEELQDSMSSDISTSFANLIKFVAGATDEEFVANAENHFDVLSVIDFDILARVFCIVDNLCRNQIFFTYDGVKWYEGCWDVDAVLGLPPTTRGFFAYNTEFQTGYIAYKDYGMTNLLYQRVENLFTDRFKARYAELRAGALSIENIIDVYERMTDTITTYDGLLAEDYASTTGGGKFTGIPYTSENNIQQIRNFVAQRIPYMDAEVESIGEESGGGGETEVTLESISATYSGGDVVAGTAVTDLTGIAVTAYYSDGSTEPVTGYTLSGTIVEGANTVTVSYGGKTATFTVTGVSASVPCTGISLDKSALTFTAEGTQTLAATVTPTDTTDAIVWSSDNTGVATVENGVVTAVGNGSCNITATCGNHTASCTVSVSGIVRLPSGYTQLEYITTRSYGTHFDTGVVPTANTAAEYKVRVTGNPTSAAHVLSSTDTFFPCPRTQAVGTSGVFTKRNGTEVAEEWVLDVDVDYEVSAFMHDNTYTVNDMVGGPCEWGTASSTSTLRFGNHATQTSFGMTGRIYYMRIYEAGELIRNYIPCKDTAGIAGMYDTVRGEFCASTSDGRVGSPA